MQPELPPAGHTPKAEGRARLKAAHFELLHIQKRGELWKNQYGKTVFVSYIGPEFGQFYSSESLELALQARELQPPHRG